MGGGRKLEPVEEIDHLIAELRDSVWRAFCPEILETEIDTIEALAARHADPAQAWRSVALAAYRHGRTAHIMSNWRQCVRCREFEWIPDPSGDFKTCRNCGLEYSLPTTSR